MSLIILIDPGHPRLLYLQIIDEIRRALVLGELKINSCLPSVRELSIQLKVNPSTVQQAYRELEREGLVYVRRGKGVFISPKSSAAQQAVKLSRLVAEDAIREAYRNGLSIEELVETILSVSNERSQKEESTSGINSRSHNE